jgi:hypothetical protein
MTLWFSQRTRAKAKSRSGLLPPYRVDDYQDGKDRERAQVKSCARGIIDLVVVLVNALLARYPLDPGEGQRP